MLFRRPPNPFPEPQQPPKMLLCFGGVLDGKWANFWQRREAFKTIVPESMPSVLDWKMLDSPICASSVLIRYQTYEMQAVRGPHCTKHTYFYLLEGMKKTDTLLKAVLLRHGVPYE